MMRRHEMTERRYQLRRVAPSVLWALLLILLAVSVLYPLTRLALASFRSDGGFGLQNYRAVLTDRGTLKSLRNTAAVVIPATLFSTALGVLLAWIVVRTDLPGRKTWQSLLAVPYLIPPFVGSIAWTLLLGPAGFLNRALTALTGADAPPVNVYSLQGMIFVMTMYRFAVPYIVVLPAMRKIDSSLEEAARVSGASPGRILRDVTLPLLTPSVIGAILMVFLFCLADFGVPAVLGAPDQIRLMSTQIYYLVGRTDLPDALHLAAAFSMLMAAAGLLAPAGCGRTPGDGRFVVVSGRSAPAAPVRLRRGRLPLLLLVCLVFGITTVSPIAAVFLTSVTKVYGLPVARGNLTLRNYALLGSIRNIRRAFANSAFLSAASALLVTVIGLTVAYLAVRGARRKVPGVRLARLMVTVPYSIPGVVIALALILAFKQPFFGLRLYGTLWILLMAYMVRFLNLGFNNISGAISQIDPSLEEASRVSGASHLTTFRRIMLPILRPSLYGSFFLVAAPTLSELSLSSLLWSAGCETVGTVVFSSQEEGKILLTAAVAMVLIVSVIVLNALVRRLSGDRMGV